MPRKRESRIYWRAQGGERRAYLDVRDLGGGREALRPKGEKRATTDPDVAMDLATKRVKELEAQRRNRHILGVQKEASLEAFASHHLLAKAKAGAASRSWMKQSERHLQEALDHFGGDRSLTSIRVEDVRAWAEELAARPGRTGARISAGTIRHRLNVLSNLYRRAISEGYVPAGFNPVAGMLDKPTSTRVEARWLEVHEAALLLESARTYRPAMDSVRQEHGGAISAKPNPHLFPILATFLLTGGRKSEVLGLEVDDVSFQRKTITFRPNDWRRLKTRTSHRPVRLWPQLEEILRAYLVEQERTGGLGSLLFPSARGEGEKMIRDVRKALNAIATRAGWLAGEITTKMFRHTYAAARLQTLDRGAPVAPWTVARELGHSGTEMVERIYGHLGQVRHRSEEVSFRIEEHEDILGERIRTLREVERADA
jgi:integrase